MMFNAAGGNIGKRADWGLPSSMIPPRPPGRQVAAWIAAVMPRLDRRAMVDLDTGQPLSPARLAGP